VRWPGLVLLLTCLCASASAAEEATTPPVSEGDETAEQEKRFADARQFYDNGKLAYDMGHFDDAVSQFERAYALRPAPLLLFNMAQCHRQLGHADKARHLYESFLRESAGADSPQAAIAVEELEKLQRKLAEEERLAAERAAAEAAATEGRPSDEVGNTSAGAATPSSAEAGEGEMDDVLLWGAVGGGVVLVAAVAAVTVGVVATLPAPGDAGRLDFR
jgi:tetratricopeptide (TPR) repeat protein